MRRARSDDGKLNCSKPTRILAQLEERGDLLNCRISLRVRLKNWEDATVDGRCASRISSKFETRLKCVSIERAGQ